jgi:hypothetical protein
MAALPLSVCYLVDLHGLVVGFAEDTVSNKAILNQIFEALLHRCMVHVCRLRKACPQTLLRLCRACLICSEDWVLEILDASESDSDHVFEVRPAGRLFADLLQANRKTADQTATDFQQRRGVSVHLDRELFDVVWHEGM